MLNRYCSSDEQSGITFLFSCLQLYWALCYQLTTRSLLAHALCTVARSLALSLCCALCSQVINEGLFLPQWVSHRLSAGALWSNEIWRKGLQYRGVEHHYITFTLSWILSVRTNCAFEILLIWTWTDLCIVHIYFERIVLFKKKQRLGLSYRESLFTSKCCIYFNMLFAISLEI